MLAAAGAEEGTAVKGAGDPLIGIGPLVLPEYLDRTRMVIRLDTNRVELSESHRWAAPLAENIALVLRQNLAGLLGSERFLFYPWEPSADVNYRIAVEVLRFEGDGFRAGVLEAAWSVVDGSGTGLAPVRRSVYRAETPSSDHSGLAAALSETLLKFSRDIARQVAENENIPAAAQ
jgi:hypothetical protein